MGGVLICFGIGLKCMLVSVMSDVTITILCPKKFKSSRRDLPHDNL